MGDLFSAKTDREGENQVVLRPFAEIGCFKVEFGLDRGETKIVSKSIVDEIGNSVSVGIACWIGGERKGVAGIRVSTKQGAAAPV